MSRSTVAPALSAMVLAAALAGGAGCTRVTTQSGLSPHTGNPWTHPGILRIGDTRVPDNLNRMLGTLTVDNELGALYCARLFNIDEHEGLQPELAVIVPTQQNRGISADGKTIVYHLRSGVRWHDGAPFTAQDVRFSWEQVVNPRNIVQSQDFYDQVTSVQTPDARTAIVRLKQPQAGFIVTFFVNYCIVPQHLLKGMADINHADYNRMPIGTGPFKIAENEPGVRIRFVANKEYWRGPPKLKEIDYRFVPDATTLLTQMRTHEIDFYRDVPAVQVLEAGSIPGTVVYRYPFARYADVGFNAGHPPLSDVRVRRALVYAMDVPALIHEVTHDLYLPADSDQPPWRWSHSPDVHRYAHDPVQAAALLDAAGWRVGADGMRSKDGQPLSISLVGLANDATALRSEQVLQAQWRAAGIDASIHNYPEDVLYALATGVEQSGKFDAAFEGWSEQTDPDNFQLYGCRMAPPAGWNVYHFCDPSLDAAEVVARGSYDLGARKRAYAQIQRAFTDGLPFYVLWYVREEDVANSDLRGYRPASSFVPYTQPWEWSI